jgi:chromate transporter
MDLPVRYSFQVPTGLAILAGGAGFILPAAVIVLAVARARVRFGAFSEAAGLLCSAKPIIRAVVVQAVWVLETTADVSLRRERGAVYARVSGQSRRRVPHSG